MGWTAAAAAGVVALFALRRVLLPFLLALVLAYVLEPPVRALQARGLSRVWAILLVYALIGLGVGAAVAFLLPDFLGELSALSEDIPRYSRRLMDGWTSLHRHYVAYPLPETVRTAIDQGIVSLEARASAAVRGIVEGLIGLATGAALLVLVPFLAFYMLRDAEHFRRALMSRLPLRDRPRWARLVRDCSRVLSGFIRGQVIIALLVGGAVGVTAALIGLPFALLVTLFAAAGEFVPYFGPILGAVPALVLAANTSSQALLQMLMALIIIHQLEQAVLQPWILGDGVGLHPLLVVFALVTAGHFFGLAGLLLAVPVAGILRALWTFAFHEPVTLPPDGQQPVAPGPGGPGHGASLRRPAADRAKAGPLRDPVEVEPVSDER